MATHDPYTDELQRAIKIRVDAIGRLLSELRGPIPAARISLHRAFALLDEFPISVSRFVTNEVIRMPDKMSLARILETILRHLAFVTDFIEEHLAHSERRELSQALSDDVAEELTALGLDHYNVILSHGEAANFSTIYGDIDNHINGPIGSSDPDLPKEDRFFALFRVPRIEGAGIYWKPILIGHEVAHVYVSENSVVDRFSLASKFDFDRAGSIPNPRSSGEASSERSSALFGIARDWLKELLCDSYSLHRYGPASVAALGEYLATIGTQDKLYLSHPLASLRVHLMLDGLGPISEPRLRRVIEPWLDRASAVPQHQESWAQFLIDLFTSPATELHGLASSCPAPRYAPETRIKDIYFIAGRLAAGIAGSERRGRETTRIQKPDVVNAAWLARSEEVDTPIGPLASKALESISFVDRWIDSGGILPSLDVPPQVEPEPSEGSSALSETALTKRLMSDDESGRIIVTPLLHLPKGTALDLRLGSRFIMFRRTRDASFDPLDLATDPRMIQVYQELSWTEQIVLHPQEMLLAATLEYLALPSDLTAQVITRSSYGRLGLLSATAVQVHPNFQGCLTLELVNLSHLPLVLTPGARVAQLVAWRTDPVETSDEKYRCPVGPEFSKARVDDESEILRMIRSPSS